MLWTVNIGQKYQKRGITEKKGMKLKILTLMRIYGSIVDGKYRAKVSKKGIN